MAEVKVFSGICGFNTSVKVESKNMRDAQIEFQTECPNLKPLEPELKEVKAFVECFAKVGDSPVFQMARKYCKHAACPVPTAIIKGVEVACGLALPKDAVIKISK
ncbi:hypothetical protein LPY66_00595 [Dehalobacter sp. DCM]|uniref:DUF6951 family protein n=1 Tax=Dehalobacter sp. DCM TaxID=2907827 RepID=UPI0030814A64|nr:hypothetical protein LPY66_00595 [Dehalobacter sp. DCM]